MLTYNFDHIKIPLYQYIYQCLKKDITEGRLRANDKLPSKRTFAKNNGISTITIQNAYDQLISEGYIYTKPKQGYYVSDISGLPKGQKNTPVSYHIITPPVSDEHLIDVSSPSYNPDNFPFSNWAKVMRNVISSKKNELMKPTPSGGCRELREAIAWHLQSFKGMLVDPDQIIIGAGTQYLYSLLIQILGPDKIYTVENPGYSKLMNIYQAHHVDCRLSSLDDKGLSIESLRKSQADIAHISPAHHFPTGITMPATRRYEILAWANEDSHRYIIEDDYDSEFRSSGKPIPPIFSIDVSGKIIYMNTFSKTLASTIRISYMVLPAHLANVFYNNFAFYSCTVSNFDQYALAEFIREGYFEKHINRMRLHYSRKRKEVLDLLAQSRYADICHVIENPAGLHFLIKIDTQKSDREIVDLLKQKNIRIRALSEYFINSHMESQHQFLVDYSNLNLELLRNILC